MAFLIVKNIVKRLEGAPVLKGVSFSVKKGDILVILGPSGCGKTTTLRIIAGTLIPDEGRVILDNRDVTSLPPWERNIGFVYQNLALFPHMTVAENIAFGLVMRKWSEDDIKRRVKELLKLLKLEGLEERYPNQLSGGQQQRVAIARALAPYPDLLLMDEPFSNLDALLREELRYEFKQLIKSLGITTVFVTHDQEEAFQLADRIAVMYDGKILQLDTPEKILNMPANLTVARFLKLNVISANGKYLVFSPTDVVITNKEEGDFKAKVVDSNFRQFFWKIILETEDGQRFKILTKENPSKFRGEVWVAIKNPRYLEG